LLKAGVEKYKSCKNELFLENRFAKIRTSRVWILFKTSIAKTYWLKNVSELVQFYFKGTVSVISSDLFLKGLSA